MEQNGGYTYKNVPLDKALLPDDQAGALNPQQFIANAGVGALKVIQRGTAVLNSSDTSITIRHSMGYQPLVLPFVAFSTSGTRFLLPYNEIEYVVTGVVKWQFGYEVVANDSITFYKRNVTATYAGSAYFTYYILQEPSAI